jgi:hypothetical protein
VRDLVKSAAVEEGRVTPGEMDMVRKSVNSGRPAVYILGSLQA